uniref:Uncharacterized protein n=1 Tax=Rhizophora mucronata TaxID=61149 RepID=A0A2P2NIL6_RHIMU
MRLHPQPLGIPKEPQSYGHRGTETERQEGLVVELAS